MQYLRVITMHRYFIVVLVPMLCFPTPSFHSLLLFLSLPCIRSDCVEFRLAWCRIFAPNDIHSGKIINNSTVSQIDYNIFLMSYYAHSDRTTITTAGSAYNHDHGRSTNMIKNQNVNHRLYSLVSRQIERERSGWIMAIGILSNHREQK